MNNLLDLVLPRGIGPSKDTQGTAQKTDAQSDLRMGVVTTVTTRGITVAVGAQTVTAAHLDSYAPAVGDPVALMAVQDSWLAMGRVVGPGNVSDLTGPGPSIGPSLIGGGMVTSTLATSTAAGPVNINGYDISFWLPPNHSALVLAGMPWFGSLAASVVQLTLTVSGTTITQVRRATVSGNIAAMETLSGVVMPAASGRSIRVIGQVQLISGGGTANVSGFSIMPGFMVVLDLGDTSFTAVR